MLRVVFKKIPGKEVKTECGILQILAYFSIFRYPLSKDEIKDLLPPHTDENHLDEILENMVAQQSIFRVDGWYLLQSEPEFVEKRLEGNRRAEKLLPRAMSIGRFLSRFPFVRGIGISGSLSKKYAAEKTDIDFFIITKANRLWIAWAFMHLFKKLTFLTGRQNYYCMNYYLDEKALKLEDRDIYTAIEIFTLIPVQGKSLQDFFTANNWVIDWFARYETKQHNFPEQDSRYGIKRMIEWLFGNRMGDRLDNYIMKMTHRRWQRKKERMKRNLSGRVVELITGKHSARSNPGMFREKLLAEYEAKMTEIKYRWPSYFEDVYPQAGTV